MALCAGHRLPSEGRSRPLHPSIGASSLHVARSPATLSTSASRLSLLGAATLWRGSTALAQRRRAKPCTTTTAAAPIVIDADAEVLDSDLPTKLPVTLLTGFLGSGKTTLLNNILRNKRGLRVAVIENEYGAIDIDSELVALREHGPDEDQPEFLVALDNGCACCTVNENFVEILFKLIDRRGEFDQVVIETTGLANPHSIIRTFNIVDEIWTHMTLDAVVTLVDAKHIERQLDEVKEPGVDNEALKQIAYADRIVLNKTDLVSQQDLSRVENRIRSINSFAQIRRTQHANIGLDFVLGLQAHNPERLEAAAVEAAHASHTHEHEHAHDHEHGHSHEHEHEHHHEHHVQGGTSASGHEHDHHSHDHAQGNGHSHTHDHKHDDSIKSFAISQPGLLDPVKLNEWLNVLMTAQGVLYRYKGILAVKDNQKGDFWFVLQGVHEVADVTERPMQPGQAVVSKLVFIGKDLNEPGIRQSFAACLA